MTRPAGPDGDDLRAAMTHFAVGVTIATTRHDGVDHAVTVNSLTSVSLDPPMVLVCIGRRSRFAAPVRAAGVWGVNVLPAGARDLALRYATRGGPPTVFADVPHHRGRTGVLLLDDALARLECRTVAVHDGGDHDIILGELAATSVGPASAATAAGSGMIDDRGPLVGFRGAFGTFRP